MGELCDKYLFVKWSHKINNKYIHLKNKNEIKRTKKHYSFPFWQYFSLPSPVKPLKPYAKDGQRIAKEQTGVSSLLYLALHKLGKGLRLINKVVGLCTNRLQHIYIISGDISYVLEVYVHHCKHSYVAVAALCIESAGKNTQPFNTGDWMFFIIQSNIWQSLAV